MDVSVVIPSLTRWGISADADLLYRALVLRGASGETLLVRDLVLSRVRVRTALDELAGIPAARADVVRPGRTEKVWTAAETMTVLGVLRRRLNRTPSAGERWRRHFAALDHIHFRDVAQAEARRWRSRALTRRRVADLV